LCSRENGWYLASSASGQENDHQQKDQKQNYKEHDGQAANASRAARSFSPVAMPPL
jgi:hypothetical protein